ncbi:uncharacterized protein ARMOST_21620 [Armillaria ostoyae]|uniref:Amino acid permease/ SLC12A domain-containing protein n=1 Tax=Armillaria ostoyae TaxID=47428 RepID=A0A284SAQ4_ARMOS|nr:uncharacterized protein ARMOST_21620 [Armillaria ostoyae]
MTAGEAENPRTMLPRTFKGVYTHVTTFFILGALSVGILLPYSDPNLQLALSDPKPGAGSSPYVIAMQNMNIPGLAHIVNALIMLSIFSAGNSYVFCASRTFVLVYCIGIAILVALLAFLQVSNDTAKVLEWFVSLTAATQVINYAIVTFTYLRFYYALKAQGIPQSSLPFRGPLQPFCSYYAFAFTPIMPFILGYSVFMPGNWDTMTFFFSYTIIGVLPILFIIWKEPEMSSLPQELVDRIIDESSDDIPTLQSCSLVSHTFLPRTRVHLFKTIGLSTILECQKFHGLCVASPHLTAYVKNLGICTRYGGHNHPVLEDPSFLAVMSLLPVGQLKGLKMMKYHWDNISESSKEALSRHSFRSVILDTNLVTDVDSLYTVFKGSTELDLSFEGIIGESSLFTTMAPPVAGPSLVKLRLEGYSDPILQSIVDTRTYPFSVNNLRSLSIIIQHLGTVNLLKDILDLPLPSLEHLNIVYRMVPTRPTLNILQLRSIELSLVEGDTSDPETLKWWVENLKGATDTSMEKIILDVYLSKYQLWPLAGTNNVWSDFARVLSGSDMSHIHDVSIIFRLSYGQAENLQLYKTAVETKMASLIVGGIISISLLGELPAHHPHCLSLNISA